MKIYASQFNYAFDMPDKYLNSNFIFTVMSYLPKTVQENENFEESIILSVHDYGSACTVCGELFNLGYNVLHLFKWVQMKEELNESIF